MKVLIITGGLVSGTENSIVSSLRKLFQQWRASEHAWLDLKIKLVFAEFLIRKPKISGDDLWAPDLTEVLLATLLKEQGIAYALATYSDLFDRTRLVEQLLSETDCVFVSTTFLRDLSELAPLLRMLKRPHNRIVVGLWGIPDSVAGRLDALAIYHAPASFGRTSGRLRAHADSLQRRTSVQQPGLSDNARLGAIRG
jgi:hypothetical protein